MNAIKLLVSISISISLAGAFEPSAFGRYICKNGHLMLEDFAGRPPTLVEGPFPCVNEGMYLDEVCMVVQKRPFVPRKSMEGVLYE